MPAKKPQPEETLADLVESTQLFEADMRNFFRAGKPQRLQRWLIASGSPEKAERIAAHMTVWFRERLASLMPGNDKG